MRGVNFVVVAALLSSLMTSLPVTAQARSNASGQTARRRSAPEAEAARAQAAQVDKAEDAIARNDFAAAEPLLKAATSAGSKDYRAWYDLGFVYSSTNRKDEAIEAYRKSVAAKPDVFESNLNLGVLLADENRAEAANFLRAALKLKPAQNPQQVMFRAWAALGRALDASDAKSAAEAYLQAARIQPRNAEPHLAAAIALERAGDLTAAEAEFRQAAELDPKSGEALAGLVNVYSREKKFTEAEAALRRLIAADPANATAHVQLGRVLAAQGKNAEAAAELEAGVKSQPDPAALRELAGLHALAQQYDRAVPEYQALLQQSPNDADLHYAFGIVLMQQHNYPAAQQELLAAIKLNPDLAEAYGNLAVVADENKQYSVAIQALDARARHLPETPATYFLRATAYDHLRDYKAAVENYHQFLTASNGKNPDQEWKARHRLVALEQKK